MLCGFSSLWWPFGWNWSYLGFLGIIWRTCGSKCGGEGGGIFPTLCVECCLVVIIVAADGPAPDGAGPSAATVMTNFRSHFPPMIQQDLDKYDKTLYHTWWRYQMKTFSTLLPFCAGNSLVTGEFPAQRPVTQSFDVFSDLRLNQQFSIQSRHRWFEMPWCSLWHYCNVGVTSCLVAWDCVHP